MSGRRTFDETCRTPGHVCRFMDEQAVVHRDEAFAGLSADPASIRTPEQAQQFVKQFGVVRTSPFGPVLCNITAHYLGGWNLTMHADPPMIGSGGKRAGVTMSDCIELPCSERSLAEAVYACIRTLFMHEFEESFKFNGRRVLNPHDLDPADPSLNESKPPVKSGFMLDSIKWEIVP